MSFAPRGFGLGRRDDDPDPDDDWSRFYKWQVILASIPIVGVVAGEYLRARSDRREAERARKHERRLESLRHRNKCERLERFGKTDTSDPGGGDDE